MQSTVWECRQAPEDLLNWVHGRMVGAKHVEQVTRSGPNTLDVQSACLSGAAILGAVLLFPIGLVLLLLKSRRVTRFWAEPSGSGTRLHIDGGSTPGVQKELVRMWNELRPEVPVAA